jgi:hypothetical protein
MRTASLLDDVDSVAPVTCEPVHHLGQTTRGETPLASTYPFPEQQPSLLVRQCGTASPRGTASDGVHGVWSHTHSPPLFFLPGISQPASGLGPACPAAGRVSERGALVEGSGIWMQEGTLGEGGGRTGWRCVPRPGIAVGLSGSLPAAAGWFFFMASSGGRRGGLECPRRRSEEERGLMGRLFWAQGAVRNGPPAVSVRHFPNGDGNGCPDVSGIMA